MLVLSIEQGHRLSFTYFKLLVARGETRIQWIIGLHVIKKLVANYFFLACRERFSCQILDMITFSQMQKFHLQKKCNTILHSNCYI